MRALKAKAELYVQELAEDLSEIVVDELSQDGSGNITYSYRSGLHRASAPGEPPAPDTGNLKSSVAISGQGLKRRVSIQADYAKRLEYGTRNIAPRPFLRPSIEKFRRSR